MESRFPACAGTHPAPTGKPLYSYQVTSSELSELSELLRSQRTEHDSALHHGDWASGFCLHVAEVYRREYNAGDEGLAWGRFERRVSCAFTQAERTALVESGLSYWKRPIRQREDGHVAGLGT